jgi:hypothetical protein
MNQPTEQPAAAAWPTFAEIMQTALEQGNIGNAYGEPPDPLAGAQSTITQIVRAARQQGLLTRPQPYHDSSARRRDEGCSGVAVMEPIFSKEVSLARKHGGNSMNHPRKEMKLERPETAYDGTPWDNKRQGAFRTGKKARTGDMGTGCAAALDGQQ